MSELFDSRGLIATLDRALELDVENEEAAVKAFEAEGSHHLPGAYIEAVVARVAGRNVPHRSVRGRRRYLFPGLALLVAAASSPLWLPWSGRNSSKELSFGDALSIMLNDEETLGRRTSAEGRVFRAVERAVRALRTRQAALAPDLGAKVTAGLARVSGVLSDTGPFARPSPVPSWELESALQVLENPGVSVDPRLLGTVLDDVCLGIQGLQLAGQRPELSRGSRIALRTIAAALQKPGR